MPQVLISGALPAQREVITHRDGPMLVVGAAGSGKSWTLTERFLWLVGEGLRPERLAFVVPSRVRADALIVELEERLTGGYEALCVVTPPELAARVLGLGEEEVRCELLGPGDRVAMLLERIDQLSLEHHDFAGSATALIGGFVRRIDRLKAELVAVEQYEAWARSLPAAAERAAELEFAGVYRAHEAMLRQAGAGDAGDLLVRALRVLRGPGGGARGAPGRLFAEVLADDVQELDLAAASLVRELGAGRLTVAGDPAQALRRFRGAGAARIRSFASIAARVVRLEESLRCPQGILAAATAALGVPPATFQAGPGAAGGAVEFWRCRNDRAQAQSVASDIERLISREGTPPGEIAVLVPSLAREGQALAVALEERAVVHRLIGEAAFFQRAEIRDLLAWLRSLADPADAAAVVRALARPPVELRSVDIARCTQIARRRKLDMVSALLAALESPQVPPEARERIRLFLKLYRAAAAEVDTARPDLYVHRLIDRLGLRRQHLYAAQADVVERLRALARFGELAAAHVRRSPQATPREFARQIAAVADSGPREQEEPVLSGARAVQVLTLESAGGLEVSHVYMLGLHTGLSGLPPETIADELLREALPPDDEHNRLVTLRQALYVGLTRTRSRAVLCFPESTDRGAGMSPSVLVEEVRAAVGAEWQEKQEELFGPAETLQSTYRLLRDELLEGTMRVGGRLGELRFDTDLDISHAVTRYLELLKVAALIARPEGQSLDEALRDVNARILQAVTSEQREIFNTSHLDDYLLEDDRGLRRRAQAVAARDEPSLEMFIPRRGDGVVLSASDIDTYRTCPLKYKFARVFRIPQEPTIHQRFGIMLHQVLERFHSPGSGAGASASAGAGAGAGAGASAGAGAGAWSGSADGRNGFAGGGEGSGGLPELLGLLDAAWRRGGFGSSEEERQLRGKAAAALTRYHERFREERSEPVWFERQFTFRLGPHVLRGRVDRVDRLPDGGYELIDYKTGRPRSEMQLAEDVQLSLYAIGAREGWSLETSRQAYYYLLDDKKVTVPGDDHTRGEWIREVATEVAEGILSQGFEPTPSFSACSLCDYRLMCPAAER